MSKNPFQNRLPVGTVCHDLHDGKFYPIGETTPVKLEKCANVYILTDKRTFEIPEQMLEGAQLAFEPDVSFKLYTSGDDYIAWCDVVRLLFNPSAEIEINQVTALQSVIKWPALAKALKTAPMTSPVNVSEMLWVDVNVEPTDEFVRKYSVSSVFASSNDPTKTFSWLYNHSHLPWGRQGAAKTKAGSLLDVKEVERCVSEALPKNFVKRVMDRFNQEFYGLAQVLNREKKDQKNNYAITGGALFDCIDDVLNGHGPTKHRPGRDVDIYCTPECMQEIILAIKKYMSPNEPILLVRQHRTCIQVLIPGKELIIQLIRHADPIGVCVDFDFTPLMWCWCDGILRASPRAILDTVNKYGDVNPTFSGVPGPSRLVKAYRRGIMPQFIAGLNDTQLEEFTAGLFSTKKTLELESDLKYVHLNCGDLQGPKRQHTVFMAAKILDGVDDIHIFDGTTFPSESFNAMGFHVSHLPFEKIVEGPSMDGYICKLGHYPLAKYTGRGNSLKITHRGVIGPVIAGTTTGGQWQMVPLTQFGAWENLRGPLPIKWKKRTPFQVGVAYYPVVSSFIDGVFTVTELIRCRELDGMETPKGTSNPDDALMREFILKMAQQ